MTDRARVAALEASGRAALPALHEERTQSWLLRVSGGDTKRVNSANPLPGAAPVERVIAPAAALYAARGLPCRFRLTPLAPAGADAVLADAGYDVRDPSWTMVAELAARPVDPALAITQVGAADLSGRADLAQAVHLRLLAAIPGAKAFAVLSEGGEAVAAGYASVGDDRAQLSDIVVRGDARGRGYGRRLVAGLLGWAHDAGCREAMLQVLAANRVARGLYRALGFADAYPYHYRVQAISAAT